MELDSFQLGSPVHLLCLLACLVAFLLIAFFGNRIRENPRRELFLRRIVVVGCLVSWVLTMLFYIHPKVFRWEFSLPLQFCNLANLLGAVAVGRQKRIAQSLVYFWTLVLCSWAILTPSLTQGPLHIYFWIFWLYHLFIPIAFGWILCIDRFRPQARDLRNALMITIAYMGPLALLNFITGWNYGYVGPGMPSQPSLMDFLGPYPIRILWILLLGSSLFCLALLPWLRRSEADRNQS